MRHIKVKGNWHLRIDWLRSIPIYLFPVLCLCGCKSHKDIVSDKSLDIDSVARSEHHRTIAVIDSIVRNIDFSFDTLKINIERPVEYAETPEVIRHTATKGRVIDRRRVYRDSVEAFNQLDTVSYKKSAAEASTEHTATTRLYNPPDGTAVAVIALIITGVLIYLFLRKKIKACVYQE